MTHPWHHDDDIIISHSSTLLHNDVTVTSLLHFTLLWLHYDLTPLHYDIIVLLVLLEYKVLDTHLYFPSLDLLKYTLVLAKAFETLVLILEVPLCKTPLCHKFSEAL